MADKNSEKSDLDFKTVFVQGVPTNCTNEQFTEIFSTQGSIKKSYVVRMQTSDPKQSTVGYVTYMTYEDAKAAANSSWGRFEVNGTKLKVKYSRKRPPPRGEKKGTNEDTGNVNLSAGQIEQNMNMSILSKMWATKCKIDSNTDSKSENKETKQQAPNFCVMISASNQTIPIKALQRMWAEKKLKTPIKMLVDSEDNIFYLIMPSKQDCLKAVTKANGVVVGNKPLKVSLLIDPSSKEFERSSKKSRIIVRNLSFACKEDDLISAFEKYGLITDVKIPLTAGGKKRGYGFVQFTHPFEAERAIKQMNMKEIKERTVAVDWAVAKEKFKETQNDDDDENDDEGETEKEDAEVDEDAEDDDKEDEDENDSSDDSGSENSDEELETSKSEEKEKKPKDKNFSSDVHEAKTLFLRNLSYDVTDEELAEFITKFGETKYSKVVQNPQTGMSKGCAFVQFLNKDEADKCLEMMNNEDSDVTLRGRRFTAVIAIDRAQSGKIRKEKHNEKKEENDKRNLHLSYEGLIRPGTLSATGLSAIELKKREKIEMKKRAKLKNPEVFVSPHRLCVHNLPRAVTDEKLKEIFMSAVPEEKDSKPRIIESRIMRDRESVNQSGVARSLGFGYVKFTKHEHALAALRELNNNPDIFSASKRPIVEFSLENRKALEAQKLRVKRQKNKLALKSKMAVSGPVVRDGKPQQQYVFTNKKKTARLERRAKAREAAGVDDNRTYHSLLPALDAGFEPSVGVPKQKDVKKPATAMEANNLETENKNRKRKAYEGSAAMMTNGKKVRTIKHFGPKIRKRDKGKVLERLRESKKLNRTQKMQPARRNDMSRKDKKELASMAGKSTRKGKAGRSTYADMASEKGFSDLVSKYYKKLSTAV